MNQKHRNINTKSALSGVDVSVDKRGSTRDEQRKRWRESQNVEEKKTKSEGGKPKSQTEEQCSAVGGAVWFLWPGPTAR